MKVNIRKSSIPKMFRLLRGIAKEETARDDLREFLNHPDYQFEFDRYRKRISVEEYCDYLMNCLHLEEDAISNQDLKNHHSNYMHFFKNIDLYESKLDTIDQVVNDEIMKDALKIAKQGLPDDFELDEIDFTFTFGIGMSFGYVHGDNTHFDVLQLIRDLSIDSFCSSLAHEIHHVCMNHLYPKDHSVLELFFIYLSMEGLAVKYCNNAKGKLSKPIYESDVNIGLHEYSWRYLNDNFDVALDAFIDMIDRIEKGKIQSVSDLSVALRETFMNFYIDGHDKTETPKLKHSFLYSFGNDIYGIIHDAFGKEKVFEIISSPSILPNFYNKACEKLGFDKYKVQKKKEITNDK